MAVCCAPRAKSGRLAKTGLLLDVFATPQLQIDVVVSHACGSANDAPVVMELAIAARATFEAGGC